MESRFSKYENEGKSLSSHIANVNNFIDFLYGSLDTIEKEIKSLQAKINEGTAPPIFSSKVNQLISLGKNIENIYETYHFNRDKVA